MRKSNITRDEAFALLRKYNKEPFHIQHALTVEGVMRWYAEKLGWGDEADYWCRRGYDTRRLLTRLWDML